MRNRYWLLSIVLLFVTAPAYSATSTTLQSAVVADGNGTAAAVTEPGEVGLAVTITGRASVYFEASIDGGTTYTAVACRRSGSTSGDVTTTSSSGQFYCHLPGASNIRAPVIGWQTGTVTVVANVLEGATGAVATESAPSYTEGETESLSVDLSGNLRVTQGTTTAGEAVADDVLKVEQRGYYTNVSADAAIKSGPGWLHTMTCSSDATATAGSLILYDNTAESGAVIHTYTIPASYIQPFTVTFDVVFSVGLYAGFTTTADVNCTFSVR